LQLINGRTSGPYSLSSSDSDSYSDEESSPVDHASVDESSEDGVSVVSSEVSSVS